MSRWDHRSNFVARIRRLQFAGVLQRDVLGTFSVIRGFANLAELAEVSIAIPYTATDEWSGTGYQRPIDPDRVEAIKRFLLEGRYRFLPEVVLSLRSSGELDPLVPYRKRLKSAIDATYVVSVNVEAIRESTFKPVRRIDGNHRLEAASRLVAEQVSKTSRSDFSRYPAFAKAPFSFVVLHSDRPSDDDLAEAMLFNLINSKAVPVVSEQSLSVLMQDEGLPEVRFKEDPQLFLTRWMRDRVRGWPRDFYPALGPTPLTQLYRTAGVIIRSFGPLADATTLARHAEELFDPLNAIASRLRADHESFVLSPSFLSIAAEVYAYHTSPDGSDMGSGSRTGRAISWLTAFAQWYAHIEGSKLPVEGDPAILWRVFKQAYDRRARSVFIAMSFRDDDVLKRTWQAIEEALNGFNVAHPGTPLQPIRIDKQSVESFDIQARIFEEIEQSQLMIADLTDERPNVYLEVGYAKSKGVPLILTFRRQTDPAPWDREHSRGNRVHFDLEPMRRVMYADPMELRDSLRAELEAVLESSTQYRLMAVDGPQPGSGAAQPPRSNHASEPK